MNAPILVTGGTGRLGRHVISRLRDAGRQTRILSRHEHTSAEGVEFVTGDLLKGEGIEAAVDGASIIVHLAGGAKDDDRATRNLVEVASRAGTQHLVHISVVGVDRIPVVSGIDRAMFGYFASKLAAEQVVADSGIPSSILRATQFYDLMLLVVRAMARLPMIPVPSGFRFQPIDEREVADRLVELAQGKPQGLVPELAGPRVYTLPDLIRTYLRAVGKHRWLLPVPIPGNAAAAARAGAILAPERAVGRRTWEEFLAERLSSEGRVRPMAA